jgi:hypothetical protein
MRSKTVRAIFNGVALFAGISAAAHAENPLTWPPLTREARPWAYNWWMGSAVDPKNLTAELTRYRDAGLGGIHIIPIYGAKGAEARYIDYLSPRWMEMLRHAVTEAERLGLGVDMTTGTGWCFGGPDISPDLANIVTKDGAALKPGRKVKRAAAGGEGWMLNPYSADAMTHYLRRFTDAFANYNGPRPRAMYHDSYEYLCNWAPNLPAEFERRRGYALPVAELFGPGKGERIARLKADYRETISDMMIEDAWPRWHRWSRERGFITRNQAHGSPGNLLDLYALADCPETEMYKQDRDKLISKFASSAAHVAGRRLVAAETGTWVNEHFQETLADLKRLIDDLFLSGVNHVFYHGCCYSPDDAAWPGWVFYAATQMNPRNSIWRDAPALNRYVARCQSILQAGESDNDVLLYWPIHEVWHNASGLEIDLLVHDRTWFREQPMGKLADRLWRRGFCFDYISDRQLMALAAAPDARRHRALVVPSMERMPPETLRALATLANQGWSVIFDGRLPDDVPGLGRIEARRAVFKDARAAGADRFLVGNAEDCLERSGIARETMADQAGLFFVRRRHADGRHYFIANQGAVPVDAWVDLVGSPATAILMDPMTGRAGAVGRRGSTVRLQLEPGHSVIVRTFKDAVASVPAWSYDEPGPPSRIEGPWRVSFVEGGPELPSPFETSALASWTSRGGEAERFAGAARYTAQFDAPPGAGPWFIDLGRVCHSARVRLNGEDLGTLLLPPYRVRVERLRPTANRLEVEVTNLSANRVRDLDRRKVPWKVFHDINFVSIEKARPFDASAWPLHDSGLLGPVTLAATPAAPPTPRKKDTP